MKKTTILFVLGVFFMTLNSFAQHKLILNINGVKTSEGSICYAVYDKEASFLSMEKVFKSGVKKAIKGSNSIEIDDLPEGTYAIAIFHDENGNDKLDTNRLGIPKEEIAFSKSKMKMFGPPKFSECAFHFISNMELAIPFD